MRSRWERMLSNAERETERVRAAIAADGASWQQEREVLRQRDGSFRSDREAQVTAGGGHRGRRH